MRLARLRRPWEERARAGWSIFILGVALCARQTREGVHSIVHGPAHPVDGSRPHSRARRTFLSGKSGGAHRYAHPIARPCPHPGVHAPDLFDMHSTHHLRGCCAQAGCDSTPPATPSSGPPPAPLQFLPRMSVSQSFRGCVWVSRSREACSVCDRGEFVRSSERAFVSLGVRGCSGRPYGPSTLIGNEYTCESSRPCCPRRSRVAPVLGGVNKSIIRCEYMLKLGVFCIALVIVMHKEA